MCEMCVPFGLCFCVHMYLCVRMCRCVGCVCVFLCVYACVCNFFVYVCMHVASLQYRIHLHVFGCVRSCASMCAALMYLCRVLWVHCVLLGVSTNLITWTPYPTPAAAVKFFESQRMEVRAHCITHCVVISLAQTIQNTFNAHANTHIHLTIAKTHTNTEATDHIQ